MQQQRCAIKEQGFDLSLAQEARHGFARSDAVTSPAVWSWEKTKSNNNMPSRWRGSTQAAIIPVQIIATNCFCRLCGLEPLPSYIRCYQSVMTTLNSIMKTLFFLLTLALSDLDFHCQRPKYPAHSWSYRVWNLGPHQNFESTTALGDLWESENKSS